MLQINLVLRDIRKDLGYLCVDTEEPNVVERTRIITLRDILAKSIYSRLTLPDTSNQYSLRIILEDGLPQLRYINEEGRELKLETLSCVGTLGVSNLNEVKKLSIKNGIVIVEGVPQHILETRVRELNNLEATAEDILVMPHAPITTEIKNDVPDLNKIVTMVPTIENKEIEDIDNDDDDDEGLINFEGNLIDPKDLDDFLFSERLDDLRRLYNEEIGLIEVDGVLMSPEDVEDYEDLDNEEEDEY